MAPDAPPPSADYAPKPPKREGFAALPRHERRRLEALQRKHRNAEAKRRREAPVAPLTMDVLRARLVAGREADPVLFDRAIALADRVVTSQVLGLRRSEGAP